MNTLSCRTAWEPAESLCSITNQHQLQLEQSPVQLLFASIWFSIQRGEEGVSTRSWCGCSPLCYLNVSAVPTTALARAREGDPAKHKVTSVTGPPLTWNLIVWTCQGPFAPKKEQVHKSDQCIAMVWTGILRVNSQQPVWPPRLFSGIPGKQQCKKRQKSKTA